jgi:hypothetical protein
VILVMCTPGHMPTCDANYTSFSSISRHYRAIQKDKSQVAQRKNEMKIQCHAST